MSEALEKAKLAELKAERRFKIFRNMFFVYLIAVTLFTSIQTIAIQQSIQASLQTSRETASKNHQRTQDYVKCVAKVLLKPLSQRTTADFDECTVKETANSGLKDNATADSGSQQNRVANETQPVYQAPQIVVRDSNNPTQTTPPQTNSAPPDPQAGAQQQRENSYDSQALKIIDGILREVDRGAGGTLNNLGL